MEILETSATFWKPTKTQNNMKPIEWLKSLIGKNSSLTGPSSELLNSQSELQLRLPSGASSGLTTIGGGTVLTVRQLLSVVFSSLAVLLAILVALLLWARQTGRLETEVEVLKIQLAIVRSQPPAATSPVPSTTSPTPTVSNPSSDAITPASPSPASQPPPAP
jgi:hypothetical protein